METPKNQTPIFDEQTPSCGQISSLVIALKNNEAISKHINFDDNSWSKLNKVKSIRQYKFLLALLFNKKYIKLIKILREQFNF